MCPIWGVSGGPRGHGDLLAEPLGSHGEARRSKRGAESAPHQTQRPKRGADRCPPDVNDSEVSQVGSVGGGPCGHGDLLKVTLGPLGEPLGSLGDASHPSRALSSANWGSSSARPPGASVNRGLSRPSATRKRSFHQVQAEAVAAVSRLRSSVPIPLSAFSQSSSSTS